MGMPPEERLGMDLKRVEQELMAAKHTAVKAARLTVPQYAALYAIAGSPRISAAALARACMVMPQAMTGVLKKLEERGLVERTTHPWHRNVLETWLTDRGAYPARGHRRARRGARTLRLRRVHPRGA